MTPGIDITNGYQGALRLRNAMEVWPSDDASRAGKLDVRDTNGTPTITLNGQSGTINARNTPRVNWDQSAFLDHMLGSIGSSPLSVTSYGNYKPAPGFFVVMAEVAVDFNGNWITLRLNDVSSGSVTLTEVQGNSGNTLTLFDVVPVTTAGGYQNFQITVNTDSGTSYLYGYNLTAMFFPLPRNN